jgi:hypothetical protein
MPTTLTIVPWPEPLIDTIGAGMSLALDHRIQV